MPSTAPKPSPVAKCESAADQAADVAHLAAHARGAAAYAAKAAELAKPNDPNAVADEVRWQQSHASPTVLDVLRRLPRQPEPPRSNQPAPPADPGPSRPPVNVANACNPRFLLVHLLLLRIMLDRQGFGQTEIRQHAVVEARYG